LSDNVVKELLERSNRLGANPKFTNYAGGNTSAKGSAIDPLTGDQVEVLYVKGSGGDLGTLTEKGLATLYLERLRGMTSAYRGLDYEDEMFGLFDFCAFGRGGAAPSIDTAMHGLVDQPHVDHLHPDSIIALATSKDGRELTQKCFGDEILWIDWRRPGFELGLDISKIAKENPKAHGCVLGGHGLTTWGATSKECEERSVDAILKAEKFIADTGKKDPFGKVISGRNPLAKAERIAKAAKLAPALRGIASKDNRMVGSFTDSDAVLDFLNSEKLGELASKGTSCPDHFLRTKISPLVIDLDSSASLEEIIARAHELHVEYRAKYTAY
jgi:rhamnose utilization protein RhaD (predicted bifunctional aldolase and dehydrogenase)